MIVGLRETPAKQCTNTLPPRWISACIASVALWKKRFMFSFEMSSVAKRWNLTPGAGLLDKSRVMLITSVMPYFLNFPVWKSSCPQRNRLSNTWDTPVHWSCLGPETFAMGSSSMSQSPCYIWHATLYHQLLATLLTNRQFRRSAELSIGVTSPPRTSSFARTFLAAGLSIRPSFSIFFYMVFRVRLSRGPFILLWSVQLIMSHKSVLRIQFNGFVTALRFRWPISCDDSALIQGNFSRINLWTILQTRR